MRRGRAGVAEWDCIWVDSRGALGGRIGRWVGVFPDKFFVTRNMKFDSYSMNFRSGVQCRIQCTYLYVQI